MASFSGFKLIGVNPHSANVGAAMLLADYVTNEENETLRFQQRAQAPPTPMLWQPLLLRL